MRAIKNGIFLSWPGLTHDAVNKFLTNTIPTSFGYLHQEQQNLQSTKMADSDFFPNAEKPNRKTYHIYTKVEIFSASNKVYGDLTDRFLYMSARGHQYFLVVYDYDSNAIMVELLKSRSGPDIKNAYMPIYNRLLKRGCAPVTFILDNDVSKDLLNTFENNNITHQQVPLEVHRRNAAVSMPFKLERIISLQASVQLIRLFQFLNGID